MSSVVFRDLFDDDYPVAAIHDESLGYPWLKTPDSALPLAWDEAEEGIEFVSLSSLRGRRGPGRGGPSCLRGGRSIDHKLIATKRHEKTQKGAPLVVFCAFSWPI